MIRRHALVTAFLFACVLCLAPPSWSADQQNRMKACSAEAKAKGLGEGKGEERQAFMKECLSGKGGKKGRESQQNKMVTCNKEATAKNLKGDDRKKFMSDCLSN